MKSLNVQISHADFFACQIQRFCCFDRWASSKFLKEYSHRDESNSLLLELGYIYKSDISMHSERNICMKSEP